MTGRLAGLVVAVAALVAAGCGPAGSGDVVAEDRDLPSFDRILVSEGIDAGVLIDPGSARRVTVHYDDNLLDRIGTTVEGGRLHVEILARFRVSGGGRFVGVEVGSLESLEASSGADVRVEGATGSLRVAASGGAAVDLSLLEAGRVEVEASGGAYVAVRASGSVTGAASGGAEVLVLGDPAVVDVSLSGGAELSRGRP